MAGERRALLIATGTYTDAAFAGLRAPQADVAALAGVLRDPEIGGYAVDVLTDQPSHQVRVRLNELFTTAGRDDLVLVYVSGHGVKDETGQLHLATTDTQRALLASTGVPAAFVRDLIDHSPARRVVVWLDCCYAGAFPAGVVPKAEGSVDVLSQLDARAGRGCAVMTASTAIQYAFERGTAGVTGTAAPSVFTGAIVEGLRTGAADLDADGEINAAELYAYVYDEVKATTPEQTPTRNDQVTGELYIARSNRGPRLDPELPSVIRHGLRSGLKHMQLGAVRTLAELADAGDERARATLRLLRDGPDPFLAGAAGTALTPPPTPEPEPEPRPRPRQEPAPTPEPDPKPAPKPTTAQQDRTSTSTATTAPAGPGTTARPGKATPVRPSHAAAARETWSTPRPPVDMSQLPRGLGNTPPRTMAWWGLVSTALGLATTGWFTGLLPHPDAPSPLTWAVPAGLVVLDLVVLGWLVAIVRRDAADTSTTLVRDAVAVRAVAFTPRGERLVHAGPPTVTCRSTVRWHEKPRQISVADGVADQIAVSPTGGLLATVHQDGAVGIVRWVDGTMVNLLAAPRTRVRSAAFSPDGSLLVGGLDHGGITIWRTELWGSTTGPRGHRHAVTSLAFHPTKPLLASCGEDNTVAIWNTGDWSPRATLTSDVPPTHVVAFSPDGEWLVTGSGVGSIEVWDTLAWRKKKEERWLMSAHRGRITALAVHPTRNLLASCGEDNTVTLWDTGTWRRVRTYTGHRAAVRSVAFSPDGRVLASGGDDRTVKLWRIWD
ncbi:caspase, EACC1-associated type [Goodfellowiella coeruleoviolacea]|uniref:WD domain-containing protein, G-beta repeat-containing protein n=1 Tax=Goodfellowiella coeruleoviolacea TaxID=334858 RepID=A0AAE3KGH3_9PSEU|nr:caspase family protein [Goodfellowiella coeruleoviolacea]MCP2165469.1 WD domain-containing protein, G-beta repeat-containing protein [Goodfellowiella coeruleoviolacea]